MVKAMYTPEQARLAATLKNQARSISDVQRPTGTEKNRSLLKLEHAIAELADQQDRIEDSARIYSASTGATHSSASWMPNPPSVSAKSLSRKFRITVTGGSSGGATINTFSTTGYSRDRAIGDSPEAVMARSTPLGAGNAPGTAQRSWVVTMPGQGPYTFTAEARPIGDFASAIGLQIDVQPVL